MGNINKNLGEWASNGSFVDTVPPGKLADGFVPGETPFCGFLNKPLSENYNINKYTERLLSGALPKGVYDGLLIHHDTGGTFSLYGAKYALSGINAGISQFVFTGVDLTDKVHARDTIDIFGTAASDGTYTVSEVSYIGATTQSFIFVEEAVIAGAFAGDMYTGGTIVTSDGIRYLVPPQLSFDTAVLPGAGSYRYDYIIGYWDNTTNTFTFEIDDAGTGHTMEGNEYLIGAYYGYNNGGTFEVPKITNGSRKMDSHQIYYVGDGVNSYDSGDYKITNRINEAILLANANGGGEVRVIGDGWQTLPNLSDPDTVVQMRSNVTLDFQGTQFTTSDTVTPYNITFSGSTGTSITTNATSNILTSAYNFTNSGIGSRVTLSGGPDAGEYIIVGIIDDNNVEVTAPSAAGWVLPSFTGAVHTAEVYLANSYLRNCIYDARRLGISVGNTVNCGVDNLTMINTDSATPCVAGIYDNAGTTNTSFSITNCHGDAALSAGSFTNSIDFTNGTNVNCSIIGCITRYDIDATGSGIFMGNYSSSGTTTLSAGWVNPLVNGFLKTGEKVHLGTGLEASIYNDGTYLIFDPRENSLSGHSKFLHGDIRIEAGNMVLNAINNKVVYNNDFYMYSDGTDLICKSVTPGATSVQMMADQVMTLNAAIPSDLVGCNDNAAVGSTKGFIYLPTLASQPTGVAANFGTRVAMAMDNSKKKWHYVGAGAGTFNNWRSRVDLPISGRWAALGTQLVPDDTQSPVIWQGVVYWDEPGANRMDTTTGAFTADVPMKVHINAKIQFDPTNAWASGDSCNLILQKDSGAGFSDYSCLSCHQIPATPAGLEVIQVNGSDLVSLAVGDQIRVTIYQDSGSNLTLTNTCYMTINEL